MFSRDGTSQASFEAGGPQFTAQGAFAAFVVTDLDVSFGRYQANLGLSGSSQTARSFGICLDLEPAPGTPDNPLEK
jgi:hypothetical protein